MGDLLPESVFPTVPDHRPVPSPVEEVTQFSLKPRRTRVR